MLPAAPARFSTTTVWPNDTRMRSLKMRASTSAGPDAGNGTTMVIGRVGNACADAFRVTCRMSAAAAPDRKQRREILIVLWDECAPVILLWVWRSFEARQRAQRRFCGLVSATA